MADVLKLNALLSIEDLVAAFVICKRINWPLLCELYKSSYIQIKCFHFEISIYSLLIVFVSFFAYNILSSNMKSRIKLHGNDENIPLSDDI